MVTSRATRAPEFKTIGKHKVLGEIGRGAMGVVYKAHDPVLNRLVAARRGRSAGRSRAGASAAIPPLKARRGQDGV